MTGPWWSSSNGAEARTMGRLIVDPGRRTAPVLLALLAGGCGSPPRGEVEGQVRCGGQPVANCLVTFLPDADRGATGQRSSAVTDGHGRYRLRGEDQQAGAVAGWHRGVVEDLAVYQAPRAPDGTGFRKPPARFSPRYVAPLHTPLRRQVQPGAQVMDLDLVAAP